MKMPFPAISISFGTGLVVPLLRHVLRPGLLADPVARTERDREQRRLLFERFGELGLGERDPLPRPVAGESYGHRFMSALWGCDVEFIPTEYPAAVVLADSAARLKDLALPDFDISPVWRT